MPANNIPEIIAKIEEEFSVQFQNQDHLGFLLVPKITGRVFSLLYQTGKLHRHPERPEYRERYRQILVDVQNLLADALRMDPGGISATSKLKHIIPSRKRRAVVKAISRKYSPVLLSGSPQTSRIGGFLVFLSFLIFPSITMITLGAMMVPDFYMFAGTILMCFLAPWLTYRLFAKNCYVIPYERVRDIAQTVLDAEVLAYEYLEVGHRITRILHDNYIPEYNHAEDDNKNIMMWWYFLEMMHRPKSDRCIYFDENDF